MISTFFNGIKVLINVTFSLPELNYILGPAISKKKFVMSRTWRKVKCCCVNWTPVETIMAKKTAASASQGGQKDSAESRIWTFKTRRLVSLVTSGVTLVVVICLVTGISVGGKASHRSIRESDENNDPFFDAFVTDSEDTGESSGIVKRAPQGGRFDRQGFSLSGKAILIQSRTFSDIKFEHQITSCNVQNYFLHLGIKHTRYFCTQYQ